jgi:hypothetical protein
MINRKSILLSATLALGAASFAFAGPVAYKEAIAPWSSVQAVKLTPALTPEVIKAFAAEAGPAAAAELAAKKARVSALLKRLGACALNAEDLKTADKYLNNEFRAEVRYFQAQGCEAFKASAEGRAVLPQAASLASLENVAASGALSTYGGSAKFFDNAAAKGQPAAIQGAAATVARSSIPAVKPAAVKPLSSNVPALRPAAPAAAKPVRPADIGSDGRVHQAVNYWDAMRETNWETVKHSKNNAERAKALLKAAAGAGFEGLLIYSNLVQVETAGARLRWDIKNGSGAGVIAADSAKLAFHGGVFFLALAPIPMLKVAKAALAGEVWAIGLMGAMASGPLNRYWLHVAD